MVIFEECLNIVLLQNLCDIFFFRDRRDFIWMFLRIISNFVDNFLYKKLVLTDSKIFEMKLKDLSWLLSR